MGKLSDLTTKLDFEGTPSHVVDFDPHADTVELEGRNGKYQAIPVKENGIVAYLSLSNQSLVRQLKPINAPCKLRITREGTSFATKYTVERTK